MREQNSKPPITSMLATLAGCGLFSAGLLLPLTFPRLPLGIAIAIGALLGAPLFVLGLRISQKSAPTAGIPNADTSKSFWPSRTEALSLFWGLTAFLTFAATILVPAAIVVLVAFLLPSGDNWGIAVMRIVLIVAAAFGWYWWLKFASATIPNWFRGKLSDEMLNGYTHRQPRERPKSAKSAAVANWQLPVVALVAFCIALGAIDFNGAWANVNLGARRVHGFLRLIQWCRGNPNTVKLSSVLLGTGAVAWYIFEICRASTRNL